MSAVVALLVIGGLTVAGVAAANRLGGAMASYGLEDIGPEGVDPIDADDPSLPYGGGWGA